MNLFGRRSRSTLAFVFVLMSVNVCTVGVKTAYAVSFFARRQFVSGNDTEFVATADLNNDGKLDVVAVNPQSSEGQGSVAILLGKGDGTFLEPTFLSAGVNPQSVAIGDFNHDGNADLLVANFGDKEVPNDQGSLSLLLGNGDGTFQSAIFLPGGLRPAIVIAVDLNNDGNLDYVATGGANLGDPSTLISQLGNGNGTFLSPHGIPVSNLVGKMVSGDFNNDGIPDVALEAFGPNASETFVRVLFGRGDGTFAPGPVTLSSIGSGMVAADFNGDGNLDLAVSSKDVTVMLGQGDGTFDSLPPFNPQTQGALLAADLNGDGIPDLVETSLTDFGGPAAFVTLLGSGDGTFVNQGFFSSGACGFSIASGDFNRDGKLDVVTSGCNGNIEIYPGNGLGQLAVPRVPKDKDASLVVLADLNQDGLPDRIETINLDALTADISVEFGNANGTFQDPQLYPIPFIPSSVAAADLDGDGYPDLAVITTSGNPPTPGAINLFFNQRDGTLVQKGTILLRGGGLAIAVSDLNRDGIPDLAFIAGPAIGISLGVGGGVFAPPVYYPVGNGPSHIAIGDVNGDGIPDVAVADPGASPSDSGAVGVLIGNGDGTLKAPTYVNTCFKPSFLTLADVNGDGLSDLAVTCSDLSRSNGILSVLLNRGNGTFGTPAYWYVGYEPASVSVADVDLDGIADVIVASAGFAGPAILLGNGDGSFRSPVFFGAGFNYQTFAIGDVNGDGKPDILGQDNSVLFNTTP